MKNIDNEEVRAALEKAMGDRLALYRFRDLSLPDLETALSKLGHPVIDAALSASRALSPMVPGTRITGGRLVRALCGMVEFAGDNGGHVRVGGRVFVASEIKLASGIAVEGRECRRCREIYDVVRLDLGAIRKALAPGSCWHKHISLTAAQELALASAR